MARDVQHDEVPANEQPAPEHPAPERPAPEQPAASRLPPTATPGLLTAAVGGLLTFLAAFLTWATVEVTSRAGGPLVGGGTRSVSGLEGDRLGKATLVIAIAALVLVALLMSPASRSWGWAALFVAGALILVLGLLDLIAIVDASDLRQRLADVPGCTTRVQCTGDRSAGVGVYLTLLGGVVIMVGALLHAGVLTRIPERLRHRRSTTPKAAV
jgi:hypothetical protein